MPDAYTILPVLYPSVIKYVGHDFILLFPPRKTLKRVSFAILFFTFCIPSSKCRGNTSKYSKIHGKMTTVNAGLSHDFWQSVSPRPKTQILVFFLSKIKITST